MVREDTNQGVGTINDFPIIIKRIESKLMKEMVIEKLFLLPNLLSLSCWLLNY